MFIPFISLVLGGSLLSLFYKKQSKSGGNLYFERFSTEIIELVTINKSTGLALGLVPFFMLIMTYSQLLHTLDTLAVTYFIFAFLYMMMGLVLVFTLRYSSYFKNIFNILLSYNPAASNEEQVAEFSKKVSGVHTASGKWGLFFILVSTFYLSAGFTYALNAPVLTSPASIMDAFIKPAVYTNWLYLLCSALSFTGGFIIFNYFYWNGGRLLETGYADFVKRNTFKVIFIFLLVQPLLLMVNVNTLPASSLSMTVFALPVLAVAVIFVALHLMYQMIKNKNMQYSGYIFVLLYIVSFFVIIADQTALSNSTKKNSLVLAANFEVFKKGLTKAGEAGGAVSGEEIFKTKCSACHKFDLKLVGPPYKESLPKYAGDVNKLVEFVKNPTKVNPAYPPMPNQGLKPAEARAIAKYILEEVKKY
ncbi:MAG: c-type cytochrome [Ignavibacteriales bacterium]|nr:c-type cytochrome [Ignavibacteriales bacterium]